MKTLQTFEVENPKAIMLVVHGSGEHIGRYEHVAKWLNEHQITMVGGDLPGLGKSKETRGHINDFNDYLKKVDEWLKEVKRRWSDIPIILFGHSMGGLIVIRYVEELSDDLIDGLIVTSPALSIRIKVPKWQRTLAKIMVKMWPTLQLKSGIKPNQVSRDPKISIRYANDPLVYSKVSVKWFFEFEKAIEKAWAKLEMISKHSFPILFLQAGQDQLVDPIAAEQFITKLNKEQVIYHHIPELYHEILNEPEKELYLQLITDWIKEVSWDK